MTRVCASMIFFLILGCAAQAPAVLHYGVEDAPEGRRLLWPAEPEVPRYMYAGQLVGEQNFRKPDEVKRGATGFLRWLAGLVVGDKVPVVLQRPQSGVVDEEGRILVTDTSRQAVFVFDEKKGEQDDEERQKRSRVSAVRSHAALDVTRRASPNG